MVRPQENDSLSVQEMVMTNLLESIWKASPQSAGRGAKFTKIVVAFQAATQAPFCGRFLRDQRGQDMTEYALIAGLLTSVTCALVPEMASLTSHIIGVLQAAADTAMQAAGLE